MSNTRSDAARPIRDRPETERRLIDAVQEIIRDEGFEKVGVSAVARKAGVSKVLIYRYFGDFAGLLREVGKAMDPASIRNTLDRVVEESNDGRNLPEILRDAVLGIRKRLIADDFSMNLMAWEMLFENELTRAFAEVREDSGLTMNRQIAGLMKDQKDIDVPAFFAVVSSSIYYLLLRSRHVEVYNGIDIRSDEGWERLADTYADMLARMLR